MKKQYDYLIVGAGLYGAVFAHEAHQKGKRCLVIDRRSHLAGNIYTKNCEGILVHQYGAHIFHTNDRKIWDYVNSFAEFNRFTNSPVAVYRNELFNLPFNMNTFHSLWGVSTPAEAAAKIEEQRAQSGISEIHNLEEQAISLVGRDIYEKLIKGYTEKQWGKSCTELPSFIIRRLPVRFTYDNNYFNDKFQGIPIGGYTQIVEKMLEGIEVRLDTDFFSDREGFADLAQNILYTGMPDEFFDYCFGALEYRSLRFENKILDIPNFQGNAVFNYTEREIPYTRIIEHKHFDPASSVNDSKTVITYEYPSAWKLGDEPYYPMNDDKNNALYAQYQALAQAQTNVMFGGRLGLYKYLDMHQVVAAALDAAEKIQ